MLIGLATLVGCGQRPERVFAVQIQAAPPPAASPAPAPAADPSAPAVAFHPLHPIHDLNAANLAELEAIPGMDAHTAAALVAGRPYKSKRELLRHHVLTAGQYARWKGYLVVHRRKKN